MEPQVRYARSSDGLSIAYWRFGDGPPLVQLPLTPFSHIEMEWQHPEIRRWYERLAQRSSVVRYDGRGNGLSQRDAADLSLDAHVRDLEAVVAQLGTERVTILGLFHSGPTAIAYAARHPDRVSHLVLWCTYAVGQDYWRAPQAEGLRALRQTDYPMFLRTGAHELLGWAEDGQASRFAEIMEMAVSQDEADRLIAATRDVDVAGLLPAIACPTLVVHRRQMRWLDMSLSRDLASRIPGARLAVVEGSSPLPAAGDIDKAATVIGELLEERVPPSKSSPSVGRMLAHYRIAAALGAGGMGEVYRATDTKLGREVALKVLPEGLASVPEALDRFRREAKVLAALDHPGIVTVYSVEEDGGVHFLTMQLIDGQSLSRKIPSDGLPVGELLAIATALADALAAAHEKGIVHRDLKPANVMIGESGRVKVLDFGIAKRTATPSSSELPTEMATREGVVMGTMPYMSPEQLKGQPLDHRTDLFSLGVILYEMASGRLPFGGSSSADLASAILRDAPRPLVNLPEGLTRIIMRCLEKSAADRFPSARDVLSALSGV